MTPMLWNRAHVGLLIGPQGVSAQDLRSGRALPAAAGVAQALEGQRGSGARLSVLLSDAYCRFAVVHRPPGVRSASELQAAAQSRFRAMFGDVERWRVACDASPRHDLDFVAGVDGAVLEPLLAQAQQAGLRVISVKPLWLAWATHFRRQTRRGRHWVLAHEAAADGGWLGLGYFEDGVCRHARALRAEDGPPDIDALLARERAFVAGADPLAAVWLGGAAAPARLASGAGVSALAQAAPWGTA